MVIISKTIIYQFIVKHPPVREPLLYWYYRTKLAEWNHFAAVKKDFNSVDAVGNDRYVFNIKGNSYRLITLIHFDVRTVYIRFIGTHAEYDKILANEI